ncbi:MAG: hypothetical protein GKR94_02030 [Gammaproteobacteria bacterium]|nr:hypothetical protein [Gammaproteobacteria bacterium]
MRIAVPGAGAMGCLFGCAVRLGQKHAIATPVNQTLIAAVKGIERRHELQR